jgi:hypothetical protein
MVGGLPSTTNIQNIGDLIVFQAVKIRDALAFIGLVAMLRCALRGK